MGVKVLTFELSHQLTYNTDGYSQIDLAPIKGGEI